MPLISSWQAENLREALERQVEKISQNMINPSLSSNILPLRPGATPVLLPEYIPVQIPETEEKYGVIALTKTRERAIRDFNKDDDKKQFVENLKQNPNFDFNIVYYKFFT